MLSEIKATSDTRLHQYESISSINSDNIQKYRSREKFQNSLKSINDNYEKFSNNNLINTHFPIANIQQNSTIISELPTVPKQAGTFIHRLVNKFFSITNTNENHQESSRKKRKQINNRLSNNINLTPKNRRQQRLKPSRNNNTNKHCVICRNHRNCFSILPPNSLEYMAQSPLIFNTNATTTSLLPTEPKIQLEKFRTLNESQSQTIASAVELIFDTLISNYQYIS